MNDQATQDLQAETAPGPVSPFGAPHLHRLPLQDPIERTSQDMPAVTELWLKAPKAGDLRGISLQDLSSLEAAALLDLLPRIARPKLTQAEFDSLSLRDLGSYVEKAAGFFG